MKVRYSSGCVVFKTRRPDELPQVLLVTSGSGKAWVFPKGGIEDNLTAEESAVKEVYEEAGVHCKIVRSALGTYEKLRGKEDPVMQHVTLFAAVYEGDAEVWEEEHKRHRVWLPLDQALTQVDPYLAHFLVKLARQLMIKF